MVMVLHWKLNRDPDLWGQPEMFKPERFLNESQDSVKIPSHFMPFQVLILFMVWGFFGGWGHVHHRTKRLADLSRTLLQSKKLKWNFQNLPEIIFTLPRLNDSAAA